MCNDFPLEFISDKAPVCKFKRHYIITALNPNNNHDSNNMNSHSSPVQCCLIKSILNIRLPNTHVLTVYIPNIHERNNEMQTS